MADDDEEVRKRNTVAAHDAATSIEALEGTALEDGHLAVPQAGGVIDGIAIIAVESARRMAMTEEEADIPPKNAPTAAAVIETHAMIDTGHPTDHGSHRDLALLLDGARGVPLRERCNAKGRFLLRTTHSRHRRLRGPENLLNDHRWKNKNQILVIRGAWLQRATRSMSMAGRWF